MYTYGSEWTLDSTMPGADTIVSTESPDEISENAVFNGSKTTAGIFYNARDCHSQVVVTICVTEFEHPYPPINSVEEPTGTFSPICALQHQMQVFMDSLLAGGPAKIVPPAGDCQSLYGP